MDWSIALSIAGALVGVVVGAVFTARNEHRQWIRTQRLEVYNEFGKLLADTDYFSVEGVRMASHALNNIEMRIELICSPRTERHMRALAGASVIHAAQAEAKPEHITFVNLVQEWSDLSQEVRWSMRRDVGGVHLVSLPRRFGLFRFHRRMKRIERDARA